MHAAQPCFYAVCFNPAFASFSYPAVCGAGASAAAVSCMQPRHQRFMRRPQAARCDEQVVCCAQIRHLQFHEPGAKGAGVAAHLQTGPLGPEQAALVAAADTFFIATHFCSPGEQELQTQQHESSPRFMPLADEKS